MHYPTLQSMCATVVYTFTTPYSSQHLISMLLITICYVLGGTARTRATCVYPTWHLQSKSKDLKRAKKITSIREGQVFDRL
jgi:hypothetical protein